MTRGRREYPAPKVFKGPKATRVMPVHRDRKVSKVREAQLVLLALKVRRVREVQRARRVLRGLRVHPQWGVAAMAGNAK